jgi:methylthioribose-1-phosphate isomerase
MSDEPPRDSTEGSLGVGRRSFFRQLGANAVRAAGNAAGTAEVVRRGSVAAAGGLLGFGLETVDPPVAEYGTAVRHWVSPQPDPEDDPRRQARVTLEYRSPYRLQGESLLILDQRRLPYELVDLECNDGHAVARAIADGAIRGAPVLAQVAAYGLFLTSLTMRGQPQAERDTAYQAAAQALLAARPAARPKTYAVERMQARLSTFRRRPIPGDQAEVMRTEPGALRAEADAIAVAAQLDHAKLARRAAAWIAPPDGRPTGLLVHGNAGALAGGMLGTALAVVQRLVVDGRRVHVWATESRPSQEGARLTTMELEQLDAPFALIADAAAGAVLASGRVDAVLFGADHVARNGDTANTIGSFPIAAAAAVLRVPVLVCAPSSTIGPETDVGASIAVDHGADGQPLLDITPASLITAMYTELGRVDPSSEVEVRAAYERSALRRVPALSAATPPATAG